MTKYVHLQMQRELNMCVLQFEKGTEHVCSTV
jgi:hypothetical protein